MLLSLKVSSAPAVIAAKTNSSSSSSSSFSYNQINERRSRSLTNQHRSGSGLGIIMFWKTPTMFFAVMIGAMRSTLANFLFPDFDLIWNFVRIPFYDVAVQDKHN